MISKIEIVFPVSVETPKGWEQKLSILVGEICDKYKKDNPGRTMWTSGHGCKPTYIPITKEDEKHRGMEFNDSIFQIEVAEREDYTPFYAMIITLGGLMKFNKEFRRDCPETIGEMDHTFDLHNYSKWLEKKIEKLETLLSVEPPNQVDSVCTCDFKNDLDLDEHFLFCPLCGKKLEQD